MPLTDLAVKNAKAGNKPLKIFDQRGLFLLVTPSGGKWWRLRYRFNEKEKLLSLGVYPDIGLKDARSRRDEARKLLANGVDPGEYRKVTKAAKVERSANSFEAIAREWFAKYSSTWTPEHANRIIRRFERDIFPWLGDKPVLDLKAPILLAVLRRIEERGALETAHRALSNCGQVFRYAIATGRGEHDISSFLRGALPPVRDTHFPAVTEPKRVAELLRAFDAYNGTLTVRCALKLAPLVFVRPGELRRAEWADFDLKAGEWRFIATKTESAHIVPLATQAVSVLHELHALTGTGRYVFPSARTPTRPMSDNAILAAMRRLGIPADEMTGHGFRAMARTILDEVLGFRPDFIEHQLAHAVRDPNGRAYNRTAHLPQRRQMMQAWADYLDRLRQGVEAPGAIGTSQ